MAKPGDRVGAILSGGDGRINFLGFGVYEGDFVYGSGADDPVGWMADTVRELPEEQREHHRNPRIRLDGGGVVWGCECWWGPEARVRSVLAEATEVVEVSIDEVRAEYHRRRAESATSHPEA